MAVSVNLEVLLKGPCSSSKGVWGFWVDPYRTLYSWFFQLRGSRSWVLIRRALLLGVHIGALDFWKLPLEIQSTFLPKGPRTYQHSIYLGLNRAPISLL